MVRQGGPPSLACSFDQQSWRWAQHQVLCFFCCCFCLNQDAERWTASACSSESLCCQPVHPKHVFPSSPSSAMWHWKVPLAPWSSLSLSLKEGGKKKTLQCWSLQPVTWLLGDKARGSLYMKATPGACFPARGVTRHFPVKLNENRGFFFFFLLK